MFVNINNYNTFKLLLSKSEIDFVDLSNELGVDLTKLKYINKLKRIELNLLIIIVMRSSNITMVDLMDCLIDNKSKNYDVNNYDESLKYIINIIKRGV